MDDLSDGPWSQWRTATCFPDHCFCEAIGEGVIRQPANTWSSLAFVLVAVWALVRSARRRSTPPPFLSRMDLGLFVAAVTAIGVGSAFYHASLTFIGQVLDVSGMYFLATFILLHRLGPQWKISPVLHAVLFTSVNISLMAAQVLLPSIRRFAFAALLIAALVVEWRSARAGRPWLVAGAGLMSLALAIWAADLLRLVCVPEGLVQGHAVWHILGAAAALCLLWRYEAEALAVTS